MKSIELARAYNPKDFEDRIYARWRDSGAFKPREGGKPYVIVIPPPNVTGVLHLGHGLNMALQDIVVRYHRMRGESALWVPGTDHAGIATQNVVEKRLRARGESRRALGREKFAEETWKVKEEHHAVISRQMARMGVSVDWSRERFTLDEGLSRAVREVFVTLYERNLLYKGNYLVNWCPSCGTALADDEVDHEDTPGKMYHLRYPVDGEEGRFLELATTRPETLLGDTAVAVNPEDPRYKDLVGRLVRLPLTERKIPVVADAYADMTFGTGVVKITPAHDPNDWEVARRHGLQAINILTPEARLNGEVPEKYRGLGVQEARRVVLEDLKAGGFYIKEEDITHAVGRCYRCRTVIEPYLSEQWFVRMKPLAEKALASWRRGEIVFYPRKWENTYARWLENIRDWCVSRQLWWGHRIPAWTCASCGRLTVARETPAKCLHCGGTDLEQDPDVLDTWFSSWLWPFSTLGWPGGGSGEQGTGNGGEVFPVPNTPRVSQPQSPLPADAPVPPSPFPAPSSPAPAPPDFTRFYPTTALVTAYDIIFFWVARMIMAGLEFTGKAPFRDIYIHGLIRDKQGRKMSKSLGNGLDPLELVDEFGADALKFTLAFMCAQGQDLLVDKESFRLGSKFANKVWNASRYILMNLEGRAFVPSPPLKAIDRWVYARLNRAALAMGEAFLSYRYNDAAQAAYEYFWNDFCDWYVEATKLSLKEDDGEKDRAVSALLLVLAESLRLLHPLLPLVTEEIYGKLPEEARGEGLLITAPYPEFTEGRCDPQAEGDFGFLQDLVRSVRTLRSECVIPPDKKLRVMVKAPGREAFLTDNASLVRLLAGIGSLEPAPSSGEKLAGEGAIGLVGDGFEALVFVADAVDIPFLKGKFSREIAKDRSYAAGLETKLGNENFLKNAPPELAAGQRRRLEETLERVDKLEAYLRNLG